MSRYTTQVRWIVEQLTPNFTGSWFSRLNQAAPKIFDFDYPIWCEQYRRTLEIKILRHYFTREIGMETVGLWKFELECRLNEIMPYYNELYKTTIKDYDYLTDTDITEDFTGNEVRGETTKYTSSQDTDTDTTDDTTTTSTVNSGTDTTEDITTSNTSAGTQHTAHSDFPQAPLENTDYASYEDYTQSTGTDNGSQTSTGNQTTDTDSDGIAKRITTTNQDIDFNSSNNLDATKDNITKMHRKGNSGSKSFTELITLYRDNLLNIDMMVINDLSDLFMRIY